MRQHAIDQFTKDWNKETFTVWITALPYSHQPLQGNTRRQYPANIDTSS
jgi:hypothetical protein